MSAIFDKYRQNILIADDMIYDPYKGLSGVQMANTDDYEHRGSSLLVFPYNDLDPMTLQYNVNIHRLNIFSQTVPLDTIIHMMDHVQTYNSQTQLIDWFRFYKSDGSYDLDYILKNIIHMEKNDYTMMFNHVVARIIRENLLTVFTQLFPYDRSYIDKMIIPYVYNLTVESDGYIITDHIPPHTYPNSYGYKITTPYDVQFNYSFGAAIQLLDQRMLNRVKLKKTYNGEPIHLGKGISVLYGPADFYYDRKMIEVTDE